MLININIILILFGKIVSKISSVFNLGHGSTWPGHIALSLNKNFIKEVVKKNKDLKIILIAGTNGKTTTSKLIRFIFEKNSKKAFQNEAGANLLNGIASTLLLHSDRVCTINYDYVIFEVDENSLPLVLNEFIPDYIILLNLFRDQLDRYGEVNSIAKKWKESLSKLPQSTSLLLNADDPLIAFLGKNSKAKTLFFGLDEKDFKSVNHQEVADSMYCPNCDFKLKYQEIYFSHLGNWQCPNCKLEHPKPDLSKAPYYPLPGTYNMYNTNAAVLFAKTNNISDEIIDSALQNFTPAFGRQEEIEVDDKKVKIFLSKNPTSFNESLKTVIDLGAKNVLLVLNDRIPDGRDVSWIWDVDFENLIDKDMNIIVSGYRCYDMGVRIKYAVQNCNSKLQISNYKFQIEEDLKKAITKALALTSKTEILYILPTYSAMLDVRKILTGKKIL